MIIFINGSFGVGKTTVSRLLVQQLPRSVLFDPEPVGVVLLRLRRAWPSSPRVDDFQDLAAWRAASIRLIGLVRQLRGTVIVPMTFSHLPYLDQFLSAVRRRDREIFHFCLTAPLAVVVQRLRSRETQSGPTEWQLRRAAECCQAHQRAEFAEHVSTERRSPQEVANDILGRLRAARSRASP